MYRILVSMVNKVERYYDISFDYHFFHFFQSVLNVFIVIFYLDFQFYYFWEEIMIKTTCNKKKSWSILKVLIFIRLIKLNFYVIKELKFYGFLVKVFGVYLQISMNNLYFFMKCLQTYNTNGINFWVSHY